MYTQKSSFLAILDYATFERKLGIASILLFAYSMHLKKNNLLVRYIGPSKQSWGKYCPK